jgi:hypothetical protein
MSLLFAAAVERNEELFQIAFKNGDRPYGALADAMHSGCPEIMNFILSRMELWEMPCLRAVTKTYADYDCYAAMVNMMNDWHEDQVNRLSQEAQYYFITSIP